MAAGVFKRFVCKEGARRGQTPKAYLAAKVHREMPFLQAFLCKDMREAVTAS